MRIGILGSLRRISRAASKPFISGIWKSRTMTSGADCCAFSIASTPFAASLQTFHWSSCSSSILRQRRISSLSSTTGCGPATLSD